MSLEFSDWGLSPTQKVASRNKALDDYINVAQPTTEKQVGRERGQLAEDTYQQSVQAARGGNAQQGSDILAKAQQQAAEKIPQQGMRQDELNAQGAMMKENILSDKQSAAINLYNRNTAEYKDKTATALANKAFEQGYNAKELAMSTNGYLADRGLEMVKSDYEAGRISAREIRDMQNAQKLRANELRNQIAAELTNLKNELDRDISQINAVEMMNRYKKLLDMQKQALSDAAEANMWGAILSGAAGIAGGVTGALMSGGNPIIAAAGAKAGSDITKGAINAAG